MARGDKLGNRRGEVLTVDAALRSASATEVDERNALVAAHAARGGDAADFNGAAVDDLSEEEQFFAQIGEADSQSKVFVYKQMPGAKEAKVWTGVPGEFDLHAIAMNFGSGDYRVKMYSPTDRGNLGVRLNKVLTELLTPEEERALARRRGETPLESGAAPLTESRVAEIVAATIRAALPQQTQADPLVQMERLSGIMKNMMPSAPAPQSMDSLALITGVAKIFRDLTPDRDPIDKGVNAGPFDLLMKYAEPIIKLATANGQVNPAAPALPAPAPGTPAVPGATAPANPAAPPTGATPEDDPMFMLKMGVRFLVEQAKRDADPQLYADMVIDQVPPEDLKQLIAAPDFVAVLAQFVPDVANHRPWFERLKAEVIEGTKPEEGAAS